MKSKSHPLGLSGAARAVEPHEQPTGQAGDCRAKPIETVLAGGVGRIGNYLTATIIKLAR